MEKTLKVSRRELKYFINNFQKTSLIETLKQALIQDKHNYGDGYPIRSLYFDNYANTDFYEKLDGVENRKKIRLRIYSSEDQKAKLEIKRKYGDNQVKSSVVISKEDALKLIECDYDVLQKYESDTAKTIYNIMKVNHLRPVVLIEYKRKAFIHEMNNIRITIDSDIRASETDFRLFEKEPILKPIEYYHNVLVEVKYDGFLLNWITNILSRYQMTRTSYSKYSNSRFIFESYLA